MIASVFPLLLGLIDREAPFRTAVLPAAGAKYAQGDPIAITFSEPINCFTFSSVLDLGSNGTRTLSGSNIKTRCKDDTIQFFISPGAPISVCNIAQLSFIDI